MPEDSLVYQNSALFYIRWLAKRVTVDPKIEAGVWNRHVASLKRMGEEPLSPEDERERQELKWSLVQEYNNFKAVESQFPF